MAKNFMSAVSVIEFDTATLPGAGYIIAGTITSPCSFLHFTNNSAVAMTISFDGGVTAHEAILGNGTFVLYFQENHLPSSNVSLFKACPIYVAGTAGVGHLYIAGYYQQN